MKRYFTLIMLALAFCGNVLAWEPVIKETHWFGMHEYYENVPILCVNISDYLDNTNFTSTSGWTEYHTGDTYHHGNGQIGEIKYENGQLVEDTRYKYQVGYNGTTRDIYPATDQGHGANTWFFIFNARWENRAAAYQQTTKKKLPAGTYRFVYDVHNGNNGTVSDNYESLFYVEINGSRTYDNSNEWKGNGVSNWTRHSIQFTVNGSQDVSISLGYGTGSINRNALETPVLFVSNMGLEVVSTDPDHRITWTNDKYIESITVIRDWTGKEPKQAPQTSFYSWIDHKLRFSVDNINIWKLDKEIENPYDPNYNANGHYNYDGLGLCNESADHANFYIHNLQDGDKFNIEYYRYDGDVNGVPKLVNGGVNEISVGGTVRGADSNGLVYYTKSGNGDVCVSMPSKAIIRAVRIIHNKDNYQRATYAISEVNEGQVKGYKYTLTGAGVLEDKRGAVPYITMRFGAENDMTFVRNLGNGEYGAASIVDETNDFNPSSAKLQNFYQNLSGDQVKDRLNGKEWTVFTCDQKASGGDDFPTIYPLYGTYYYFFPEVNGKLSIRFYAEGANEHMPFWFKTKDGVPVDALKAGQDSNGSYYYEINNIEVEKGGVYYLCANPTLVQHEHPIVRLISYSFIPTFRVEPLYKVVANASTSVTGAATIKGVTIDKFTGMKSGYVLDNDATIKINGEQAERIKVLGNVKKDGTAIKLRQEGDDIKLDFESIAYKEGANVNKGGAIVVHLDCPAGEAAFVLTVAYDAANKNPDGTSVTTQVKKWDFYDGGEGNGGILEVGKYGAVAETDKTLAQTNFNEWTGRTKLFKEVNKFDGLTADWVDTYVNLTDGKNERIFKSVYDMEGDNADMLHETAGLVFLTGANRVGINNENDLPTSQFQDRYIGLMKGGKFTIPLLDAGDRIVLKMGTYNNEAVTLGMTNAKDVSTEGKTIGNDYIIGGSVPVEGDVKDADNNYVPRGEYHIQAIAAGDVDIEVVDGQLLKLYTIEIYRNAANSNADILTENSVTTKDGPEMLITDDETSKEMEFSLRYSGYEEPKAFRGINNSYTRGNLGVLEASRFTTTSDNTVKVTFNKGDFGSFRADMAVKTTNSTYVTDYTPGSLAVGYLETMPYPYTWDFTDMLEIEHPDEGQNAKYISNAINTEREGSLAADYKGWTDAEGGYCMRNAPMYEPGILFANGGQLYGATTMFKEIAGIGFKRSIDAPEKASSLNRSLGVLSAGLELNCRAEGMFHKLVLQKVPAGAAIYVRATPIDGAEQYYVAKFSVNGKDGEDFGTPISISLGDNLYDKVYIMKNDAEQDVELWLNGMSVKKIAVSEDFKKIGKTGYATESRTRIIDHRLTEFFTGQKVKAYWGQLVGDKVKLQEVEFLKAATEEGDATGCILYNDASDTDKTVDVIDGGFHLFVPDMHDKGATPINGNVLLAYLNNSQGNVMSSENETSYVLSAKYYHSDQVGLNEDEKTYTEGKSVAFYKVDPQTGARLSSNSAYIKRSGSSNARLAMFFDETTGIQSLITFDEEDEVWYTLSGVRIEAPGKAGIYIRNGKKVVVK